MNSLHDPSRRRFLGTALSAGIATAGGGLVLAACGSRGLDRQLVFRSLDEALRELDRLAAAPALAGSALWTWPQTLIHCAQSIEYSITGFPQPKSKAFQQTVGSTAFAVFQWRGHMSHDLAEPIPGAPTPAPDADTATALARLRRSFDAFRASPEPLQPHFAYGALGKRDYEQAHAMHLANHFSAFELRG